ncbi:MAG: hypothetical protein ACRBCI_04330, partial [Cellvibrionaceae bacterium]
MSDVIVDRVDIKKVFDRCISNTCLQRKYANSSELVSEFTVYPFPVHHVECVYTHRRGQGDGVWFRLVD